MLARAVRMLGEHKILAWMQGRMEFGPRALGNRSILASPLDPYSTENLNVFIKHREPFRKFAASVPAEVAGEYFEAGPNARYLATVGRVRPKHRKTFETAILGEDMIRAHVVAEKDNPLYHRLLLEAGKATGLPVLYNTSFNPFQFWDGRATSLEEQAIGPIHNPIEMAETHETVVPKIAKIPGYQKQFRAVFGCRHHEYGGAPSIHQR